MRILSSIFAWLAIGWTVVSGCRFAAAHLEWAQLKPIRYNLTSEEKLEHARCEAKVNDILSIFYFISITFSVLSLACASQVKLLDSTIPPLEHSGQTDMRTLHSGPLLTNSHSAAESSH